VVFGINNSGQLVGAHREAPDFIYKGFVSGGGEFTTVDVPGAIAEDSFATTSMIAAGSSATTTSP
jgi:hypothetical protein